MKSKNFSYINTLISDTEEDYELKALFEDIDRTIEMLEEEAPVPNGYIQQGVAPAAPVQSGPVPSSPMQNVRQAPQRYPNEKDNSNISKSSPDQNPKMVQAYINPSSLGPKYILIEVEKFRNLSPEDCAKLTSNPNVTRQNLPASTQHMKKEELGIAEKAFSKSMGALNIGFYIMRLSMLWNPLKAMVIGIMNFGKSSFKFFVGPGRPWFVMALCLSSVLVFSLKIFKTFNKKNNKKNSGVRTDISVSKISNESVYLTIIDEVKENNISFKEYIDIINEASEDSSKISSLINKTFDTIVETCRTLEETSSNGKIGTLKNIIEKIAGSTTYALVKAKSYMSSAIDG